jgi:GTP-binding protein
MLSEEDIILAKSIRKLQKNTVLLANKSESKKTLTEADLKKLGLGEGIFISAEHKLGFEDIYQAIKFDIQAETELVEEDAGNLSIAIIGRPNVGKSTLFNSILGFERSLVSDIAGTTRDYLLYEINTNGITINLIDTAGVRRKSRVQEKIEELSITKTVEAIKASNIVLLLMDSENAFEKQDLILANLALRYNKLLVPIINKQDLIEDIDKFKDEVKYLTTKRLPQIKDVSTIFISAQENFNHKSLFKKIINLWNLYNIKIPTSKLNNWLYDTLATYSLPIMKNNIKLKIKYVKQNSSCPPTFVFFINLSIKVEINKNFEKFLTNSLRAKFSLHGIPIKTHFIFSKNPFIV